MTVKVTNNFRISVQTVYQMQAFC